MTLHLRWGWARMITDVSIDQFHKSQNAPVPYLTMLRSEQKCAHLYSEWSILGFRPSYQSSGIHGCDMSVMGAFRLKSQATPLFVFMAVT